MLREQKTQSARKKNYTMKYTAARSERNIVKVNENRLSKKCLALSMPNEKVKSVFLIFKQNEKQRGFMVYLFLRFIQYQSVEFLQNFALCKHYRYLMLTVYDCIHSLCIWLFHKFWWLIRCRYIRSRQHQQKSKYVNIINSPKRWAYSWYQASIS